MDTESAKSAQTAHLISLHNRESLEIRGVLDVISFDEQTVVLNTGCGMLTIDGSALHIRVLSIEQGMVTMDGRIDGISYSQSEPSSETGKGGFFKKLFR